MDRPSSGVAVQNGADVVGARVLGGESAQEPLPKGLLRPHDPAGFFTTLVVVETHPQAQGRERSLALDVTGSQGEGS